jgi:sugar lactone lactonase YvrE
MIAGWRLAQPFGFELGEHPVWDARTRTLWCVDVYGGAVVARCGTRQRRHKLGSTVGAMALREDGGVVALVDQSIVFFGRGGRTDGDPIPVPVPDGARFNDAACDPAGRLLFGTAARDGRSPLGELRMLDAVAAVTPCLDGLVESNGLGWSKDGRILYFIDSIEPAIRRYDYDVERGQVGPRRADLACTDGYPGFPDGIAIDSADTVWVALWQGGRVHRYSSDGQLLEVIRTPTPGVTCCGFGGASFDELYLASGWEGLDAQGRAGDPHAGHLFVRHAPVPGLPAARLSFSPRGGR